jgi:hypothetical protein
MANSSSEIERELAAFYRAYINLFNSERADRFMDYFARRYASISGARGMLAIDNDPRRADAGRIFEGLKRRGWVRSEIVSLRTWAMDENLGMIVAEVNRVKADNSILETVRACYIARREGNSWKIVAISEIKPPYRGPGGGAE